MAIQFVDGAILFDGGAIAMHEDCCCEVDASCCVDVRGAYPGFFPATLNCTITNSCCASFNQTVTLVAAGSSGLVQYTMNSPNSLRYCNGLTNSTYDYVIVQCQRTGTPPSGTVLFSWYMAWGNRSAGNSIRCVGDPLFTEMTLLSCDPLHLILTGKLVCNGSGIMCVGSCDIEITE